MVTLAWLSAARKERDDLKTDWKALGGSITLSARRFLFISLGLSLCGTVGCVSQYLTRPGRSVHLLQLENITSSDATSYAQARLGVFLFSAPPYALGAEKDVTAFYVQELLRSKAFAQITMVSFSVDTDEAAISWGRREGYDLVMRSSILYLLGGSGAQATQLETNVRILDVRSGRSRWESKQKAVSEPGSDIDLFWTTLPGAHAHRYGILAKSLAEQFSQFLAASH